MKRTLICVTLLFAVLFCRTPTAEAFTYGATYYKEHLQQARSMNYRVDPIYLHFNEIDTTFAGTSGITALYFTPGTAPEAAKGVIYYDLASEGLLLHNGTNWLTIDMAGGTSLDASYNLGSAITVDTLAVIMTTPNTSNNRVLELVQNDTTNNPAGMLITNTGTGAGLTFTTTGTNDIDGTGSSWQASAAGTITAVGLVSGASDIVMENAEIIHNTNDTEIGFKATEDIVMDLDAGTNIVGWKSNTGVHTWDYGSLTTISGMTTITGDAADFTIGSTGNAGGEDVIIQQAGVGDNQLVLQSAGNAANALRLVASAAGIDLDATGSTIVMTNTSDGSNDDFTIEVAGATDSSLILQSTGTGGDALSLITSAATGNIKIASSDKLDIDAADDILIDIAGEAGEDFILTNTGGSIILTATESAIDAIKVEATTGGIDILASGATTGEDIDIANTGGSVHIVATEAVDDSVNIDSVGLDVDASGSIVLSSTENTADSVVIQSTVGGIDIRADASTNEDIDISNAGGAINISSTEASNDAIKISTSDAAGQITISATDTTADGINMDSTGGIDIDAGITSDIAINAGQILIESEQSVASAISLITNTGVLETMVFTNSLGTDDASIDFDSTAGGMDIDVAKSFTLTSTEGGADAIVVTSTNGGIDLVTTGAATGEDIDITSSASVNITSAEAAAQTIVIATSGGGDATETIDITNDQGTAASATTQTDAAIQIEATVGGISLESGLSGADAIRLETSESGALITIQSIAGTGASATTQQDAAIQLYAEAGGIGLTSDLAGADAVRIEAQGADGTINIQNILGTTASATTQQDAAIQLYAEAGGIGLASDLAGVDAIRIETSNAAGLMTLQSIAGTGASATTEKDAAIQLYTQAGGIGLYSGLNNVDAIRIETAGVGALMTLQSTTGTGASATTEEDASIQLYSQVGGIGLSSGLGAADAIRIEASAAAGQITIQNIAGTTAAAATQSDASIQLFSQVGGIGLRSALNGSDAIRLEADGGANEIIILHANQGTLAADGASSIQLLSDSGGIGIKATAETDQDAIVLNAAAGGVDIIAATGKDITLTGGQITLASNENVAGAITLTTNTDTAETIIITNTAGTDEAAIDFVASAGGITFTTSGDTKFENDIDVDAAIVGDGLGALSGMLDTVTNDTDGKVLTVAETGTVQTNAGAGGPFGWTLPGAAAGVRYTFVVMAAFELRVTPAGGDKIYYGSTAMDAAEYYYADAVGESLIIEAVDGTNWIVLSSLGTWAEQTP